jgi:hypothetical protein
VTDEPLRIEMDGDGHGAGGFSAPPPHQINPYEAVVFASRNTGDLHGSLRLVGAPERLIAAAEDVLVQQPLLKKRPKK